MSNRVVFCTPQLQVSGSAKVSPAEEVAELERRREQLDTEIAQLEAEWVQLCLCLSVFLSLRSNFNTMGWAVVEEVHNSITFRITSLLVLVTFRKNRSSKIKNHPHLDSLLLVWSVLWVWCSVPKCICLLLWAIRFLIKSKVVHFRHGWIFIYFCVVGEGDNAGRLIGFFLLHYDIGFWKSPSVNPLTLINCL